jgi:hypothetical protein
MLSRKPIEQFGHRALGAVLAVHKRRNYGDAQVSGLARMDRERSYAELVRMDSRLNIPQKTLSNV